jgi:glutathione synthase/RimK-type ligase-like ATP-grasp enzyme
LIPRSVDSSVPSPIACLYGRTAAAFVEPIVADIQRAGARRKQRIDALAIEDVVHDAARRSAVERLYVLPFDPPRDLPVELPVAGSALVRALFPRATIANSTAVHDLCWDKIATARKLLDRGVPVPETLITNLPEEAAEFVREQGHAVLKEPRSCGGQGHWIVFPDDEGGIVAEARGRRCIIELEPAGIGRRLEHGILHVPPPFLLQRLMSNVGRGGLLVPAQILRAYLVDGQVMFWTERFRDRIRRPSDFVISVSQGAKYRFLRDVSEEAKKIALRAAEALDVRIGVVDLVHAGDHTYVLELDTDGHQMFIDRSFKQIPDFRDIYDFDDYIAESLVTEPTPPPRRFADAEDRRSTPGSRPRESRKPSVTVRRFRGN